MSGNQVRLTNGQRWTKQQFLDHYFQPSASGTPTPVAGPPAPVDVDRSWYMDEGPGRFYHPGMFPIIRDPVNRRNLTPGPYDLWKLAPAGGNDPTVRASLSNYFTNIGSADYLTRVFVFGNESARISGRVTVNPDGSKTFHGIEIRPRDTNFDFEPNTNNRLIETPRALARKYYDPDNLGTSYDIQYRGPGPGRLYDSFTDAQLRTALDRELMHPGSGPPWLLPSITGKPPLPYGDEQIRYLDQTNPANPQAAPSAASAPAAGVVSPANQSSFGGGLANWAAGLAGVDPTNPMQPAPQPTDRLPGLVSNQPMPDWPFPPPIFGRR
jgi:hypothetical protein